MERGRSASPAAITAAGRRSSRMGDPSRPRSSIRTRSPYASAATAAERGHGALRAHRPGAVPHLGEGLQRRDLVVVEHARGIGGAGVRLL